MFGDMFSVHGTHSLERHPNPKPEVLLFPNYTSTLYAMHPACIAVHLTRSES